MLNDVSQSQVGKKSAEISGSLLEQARDAVKMLERSTEILGKSTPIKTLSEVT